jgi:hypothetical protein
MSSRFAQPLDLTNADEALLDRFWKKVDIGSRDECWEWMSHRKRSGYGQFTLRNGVFMTANRIALALSIGRPLVAGECACHTCDNPPCCNPAHLFAGTVSDNIRDCVSKGRKNPAIGERTGSAKLTESEVRAILSEPARFGLAAELARKHGVSHTTIRKIRSRQKWAHVQLSDLSEVAS